MSVITSLHLDVGKPSPVVTVENQDGVALPQSGISWALDPAIAEVTVTPSGSGFVFEAPAGSANASGNAIAKWTANGVVSTLVIAVEIAVTALQFTVPDPAPTPAPAA